MSFLTRNLNQTVVYWGTPSPDGFGGNTFATYVEINGRWEDSSEKFINPEGEEVVSKAMIFLDQDVDIGGWLYLGDTDDISSANQDSPENVDGAYEIRAFMKTPNIDADDWERVAVV